jgi:hypothetical protein
MPYNVQEVLVLGGSPRMISAFFFFHKMGSVHTNLSEEMDCE